jgi:site-specific recombinase XerD
MRLPKVSVIFDRKHRTPEKPGDVEIRISMNSKRYYISTGIKTVTMQSLKVTDRERISIIQRKIEKYINDHIESGEPIYIDEAKALLNMGTSGDLLDFICERRDKRTVGESTRKRYDSFINGFESYGMIRNFSDVDMAHIKAFDEWLHHEYKFKGKHLTQSSIYNYHKILKAFLRDAVTYGKITKNPYDDIELDKGEREVIDYLSEFELEKLKMAQMPNESCERTRDLFLFQTMTALSYSDLMAFDFSDYQMVDGNLIKTDGTRTKTGKQIVSMIMKPALAILQKYNYQLPRMCNQDYNRNLKIVAACAHINKNLHTHMARATFATYALSHGAKIQNVSKMLGHSNTTITMKRYAKVLAKDVISDFKDIERSMRK